MLLLTQQQDLHTGYGVAGLLDKLMILTGVNPYDHYPA